ncbi:MAG: hypothetical protein KBD60_02600 [Sterolibacterium sp.]|nr:hypothetical protein [Sterolibacterium sp.]
MRAYPVTSLMPSRRLPFVAGCLGVLLSLLSWPQAHAAPVMGTAATANLLTTDPLNGGITYGGTWGDDGIFDSTPVYSYNWHWNWITLGIAGYAYDHTFDDPDCNALGEWSPWNCPGITFNDTSSLVLNAPNGKSEWNSGTSSTTTPGTFISTFKARQTAMMRAQSGLIGTTTADYYMPKFSVTVPVTGSGLWKLDLKVKRNGIVQRNGAGSDYIIVRPLYTTVSGGSLASGSLNLASDTMRSSNGSWNVNQTNSAILTGSGAANLTFNIEYEVDARATASIWVWDPDREACWRAGQGNGANGGGISCNPPASDDQGVFLEGTFSFIDHLRYEFDPNAATTCTPFPVTVKACADNTTACSSLYTGGQGITPTATAASGTFLWASTPLTIPEAGSTATSLTGDTGGIPVTLGASGGIAVQCFNTAGVAISCTVPSLSQCSFAILDGYNKPWTAAKSTHLYTKLAGVAFPNGGVTLATINPSGKMTQYTGAPTVELVNAGTGTNCANRTSLATISTAAYLPADNGEKNFAVTYADAVANAQIRATDLINRIPATCSDSFTLRPQSLTLTSDILAALSVKKKAGSDTFTLTATAKNGAAAPATTPGYTGTPKLDATLLQGVRADLATNASFSGAFNSSTFGAANNGISTLANITYGEVGYFNLKDGAIYDDSFTGNSGDITGSDCTADYSNVAVNGQYGCKFKAASPTSHGRFYPDHYRLSAAPACTASNFTYSGQSYATLAVAAENGANATTKNYNTTDGYSKAATLSITNPGTPGGSLNATSVAANSFGNGVSSNTTTKFTFTSAASAPTVLTLHAAEAAGGDGVSSVAAADPTTPIWSGRLRMQSQSGGHTLDLNLPMRLERYEGTAAQWQANSLDACTSINLAPLTYLTLAAGSTCVLDSGNPGASGQGCASAAVSQRIYHAQPGALAMPAADFNLWLSAPNGNAGTVQVTPNTPAWLGAPSAIATFGSVRSSPVIYRKEQY